MPLLAWLGFVALIPLSPRADPVFWEHEISSALDSRDSCYREAGIDSARFQHLTAEPGKIRTAVQDTTTPWFCFLRGLASGNDINIAASWFARAVAAAEGDPGKLWVLAVEFDRCGLAAGRKNASRSLNSFF